MESKLINRNKILEPKNLYIIILNYNNIQFISNLLNNYLYIITQLRELYFETRLYNIKTNKINFHV